ncbi:MAG: hypothetical protein JEY79_07330 [Pseudodesulfovibrio sp.]|nr:hypothetical protein [Pseudodesulfovibrio sp.]
MASQVLHISDSASGGRDVSADVVLLDLEPGESSDDSALTLQEYFVANGGALDFFSTAKELFMQWAEESRFIEQATIDGHSLLCPLRWFFYQQMKSLVQKVEVLHFAISHLRPARVVVSSSGTFLPHLIEQICKQENIDFIVSSSVPVAQSVASRLMRGQLTWPELKRAVILKWHNVFTHSITPKVARVISRHFGAIKFGLYRKLRGTPSVLFVSTVSNWQKEFGENGVCREVILGKLIDSCRENGKSPAVLSLTDDPDKVFLSSLTYPLSTIPWDAIPACEGDDAETGGGDLAQSIHKWAQSSEAKGPLKYRGVDLSSLLLNGFADSMISFAAREKRELARSRQWLEAMSPERVVLIGELSSAVSMVIAASQVGIPTVGVSHAVIYPNNTIYSYSKREDTRLVPQCSKFCVWGKYEKELVTGEFGFFAPDDVHVIGSPKRKPQETAGVREVLSIDSDLPIALCTSNNRHHNFAQFFMREWAPCKDEYYLVVKMHPREVNCGQFQRWAEFYGIKNVKIIKNFDTLALLSECAIHLSFSTTVIIEAAWLGVPTILIDGGLKNDLLEAVDMGVAYYLSEYADLPAAIGSVLADGAVEEFERNRRSFVEKRFEAEMSPEEMMERVLTDRVAEYSVQQSVK